MDAPVTADAAAEIVADAAVTSDAPVERGRSSACPSTDASDRPSTAQTLGVGDVQGVLPSELTPRRDALDKARMSALRMLALHSGIPFADVEASYHAHGGGKARTFAEYFCSHLRVCTPFDDPDHVARVYFPEGLTTRTERRNRALAFHSRMHIHDVESSMSSLDVEGQSKVALLAQFIAANADRLPTSLPSIQELADLI